MNAVEINGLTKRYPGFTLEDVSLKIPTGFITGFVGANGSGKTTTINCALGLVHPDAGNINMWGHERIGVVFDVPPYHAMWRVKDVAAGISGFYPYWDAELFTHHMAAGGIDQNKKVKDLSRGMGMRLQFAVALAHKPDLLILDEPTSGLDPLGRQELRDQIADFMTDENHAVWFSTHITSDLDRLADNLIILNKGRIFASGTVDEVLEGYRMLQGPPGSLPSSLRDKILGLRETPNGWQGLAPLDLFDSFGADVTAEIGTIEDLAIHVAKESHHD